MTIYAGPSIPGKDMVISLDIANPRCYRADKNILNPGTWINGTTGSQTGFSQNGTTAENVRILAEDPFGNNSVIWECQPAGDDSSDGGWNTSLFDIDHTKMYRFSVWVNRNVLGTTGRFYLGLNGYNSAGSNIGVLLRSSGSNQTNPYFYISSDPPTSSELPVGEWILAAAHVWPSDAGTGSVFTDTGLYKVDGTKMASVPGDFVWRTDGGRARHRAYLFYCEDPTARQRFVYPRVDLCDGTEPSIEDLLKNRTNGLYLYNQSGDSDGVIINGASFITDSTGGLSFDGSNDYVNFKYSAQTMDFSLAQTICMWLRPATGANSTRRNPYNQAYGGSGTITHETNGTINYYFGTNGGDSTPYSSLNSVFIVSPNETAFIAVTRDQNTNTCKWYKNGKLINTGAAGGYATTTNSTNDILIGDGYTSPFIGNIYMCNVYNTALSEEEIYLSFISSRNRFGLK